MNKKILTLSIVAMIFLTATYAVAHFSAQKIERTNFSASLQRQIPPPVAVVSTTASTTLDKTIVLTMDMDMNEAMADKYKRTHILYYDPRIIDYLEKEKISTTFFVSGLFAETYPDFMRTIAVNPLFSFQNHSYDESGFTPHCYWLKTLATPQEKIGQITRTQAILKKLTGNQPRYFRYPGLCGDKKDDALVQNLRLTINEGDIFAADPFNPDAHKIVKHVFAQLKNKGVILMHVGGPNASASYDALVRLVPSIRAQGFRFEKLE